MALAGKGSCRVVVDGVTCRWRVRGRPACDRVLVRRPLGYAVEQAEAPGSILVVITDRPHPGNWFEISARPVLSAEVAFTIRTARARGWTPGEPGSPFLLGRSRGFVPSG
ncbi:hypothetical protein [Streptomyces sp. NPDC091278]|uniref:hypothetical protein n=1 Tax=Streptomyces sp. NPDC091278 TaxID=3155301 RepID=UPI00344FFE01